jgi:hypothetical protein
MYTGIATACSVHKDHSVTYDDCILDVTVPHATYALVTVDSYSKATRFACVSAMFMPQRNQ